MPSAEETLRSLTSAEPGALRPFDADPRKGATQGLLDDRTEALIRIGALVALDAPEFSYLGVVESAFLAGATLDEVVAVLLAVAGAVGSARVASAAPRLAIAAGYDIECAVESSEPHGH